MKCNHICLVRDRLRTKIVEAILCPDSFRTKAKKTCERRRPFSQTGSGRRQQEIHRLPRQAQDEGKTKEEKRRTAISTKSEESCWSGSTYLLESRPSPSITSRYLLLREREKKKKETTTTHSEKKGATTSDANSLIVFSDQLATSTICYSYSRSTILSGVCTRPAGAHCARAWHRPPPGCRALRNTPPVSAFPSVCPEPVWAN